MSEKSISLLDQCKIVAEHEREYLDRLPKLARSIKRALPREEDAFFQGMETVVGIFLDDIWYSVLYMKLWRLN